MKLNTKHTWPLKLFFALGILLFFVIVVLSYFQFRYPWKEYKQTQRRLHVGVQDLVLTWPLDHNSYRDTTSPKLFVNEIPIFQAQYQHAQSTLKWQVHSQREIVLQVLIRDELMRQEALLRKGVSKMIRDQLATTPTPQESKVIYKNRNYLSKQVLLGAEENLLTQIPSTIPLTDSSLDQSTLSQYKISYQGYQVSFQGISPQQKYLLESRLKQLEQQMKHRRITWNDLKKLLPSTIHDLVQNEVTLNSPKIPPALNEYWKQQFPIKVGEITPLLINAEGAWWVRVKSLSKGELLPTLSESLTSSKKIDQMQRELKRIYLESFHKAHIEVPLIYVKPSLLSNNGLSIDKSINQRVILDLNLSLTQKRYFR